MTTKMLFCASLAAVLFLCPVAMASDGVGGLCSNDDTTSLLQVKHDVETGKHKSPKEFHEENQTKAEEDGGHLLHCKKFRCGAKEWGPPSNTHLPMQSNIKSDRSFYHGPAIGDVKKISVKKLEKAKRIKEGEDELACEEEYQYQLEEPNQGEGSIKCMRKRRVVVDHMQIDDPVALVMLSCKCWVAFDADTGGKDKAPYESSNEENSHIVANAGHLMWNGE